jgi:dolichol-phosphate mannosyltransferase
MTGPTSPPTIVCIIPTLNEGETIGLVIERAKKYVDRVVVVDGLSDDDTSAVAWDAGAEVVLQDGTGKGMALRTVFAKVPGDIYVTIDGDATYDPLQISRIVAPILRDEADVVIGSRLQGKMEVGSISRVNIIGNRLFNFLINAFFNGQITDSQSGFRALSREALDAMNLVTQGFEIETEMTIQALKRGLRVLEVPISYLRRRGTPSKLNALTAGSRILRTILRNV